MTQPSAPAPVLSTGAGADARAERSTALDGWLAKLYAEAGGGTDRVALVAVGGLGRRECAPRSDLDLVLLHACRARSEEAADALRTPVSYQGLGGQVALQH